MFSPQKVSHVETTIPGAITNLTDNYSNPTEVPYPNLHSRKYEWAKEIWDEEFETSNEVVKIPSVCLPLA